MSHIGTSDKTVGRINSTSRVNLTGRSIRPLAFIISLILLVGIPAVSLAQTVLPGFRASLVDEPGSLSDFRAKLGGSTSSGAGPVTAEIEELARGLKYEPALMYKVVHDYIEFSLIWGDLKGSHMTWMDRQGNGFDQASLMVALLNEAADHGTGHTITNVKYKVGEIRLTADQAWNWLGIPSDPNVARTILARAGMYGEVNEDGQGDMESLDMVHVWVKATIDGQTYEFDPSFKAHTIKGGLYQDQLTTAMGYDHDTFLADANEGATIDGWVKDVNKANIAADLTEYTENLIECMKTDLSGGDITDVLGARLIQAAADSNTPPTTMPYTVLRRDDEFAVTAIPNIYRTTLRIQHCGIDKTYQSSQVYGRRLIVKYNGSNQPQLVLDGTVEATGNATTPGQVYDLTVTVTHPYDSTSFDGTTTMKVKAGGFYFIVNGWGDTGIRVVARHREQLQQYRYENLSDTSEQVLGESYGMVGWTWLAQTSQMRQWASQIGRSYHRYTVVNHHMVGIAGQYTAPYLDMAAGQLGITNHNANDYAQSMFVTIAGQASAFEHQIIRQLQDANAVSTVKLLEMANDRTTYDKLFEVSSSNWTYYQTQLQGYSQDEKDQVSAYVNAGYTVQLPQYGDLTQDDWTGTGFQAFRSDSTSLATAFMVTGGYSGGCATDGNDALSPTEVADRSFEAGKGGTYTTSSTDLSLGSGGFPFGLSFSRAYDSDRGLEDGPLGLGWTHNFDVAAKVSSDGFYVLGADCPQEAAAQIVTLFVAWDIQWSSTYLFRTLTADLGHCWLMDQVTDNVVTFEQGGGKTRFVKVPGSTYEPPAGANLKLVLNNGNYRIKDNAGKFYDFDSSGRMSQRSDAFGNVVDYTYTSGRLTKVACKIGGSVESRTLTFSYTGDHITTVTDSADRTVEYAYDGNELVTYTNPDGNDVTYEYDANYPGRMTQVYIPGDVNPVLTNVYDTMGRLKQQIDANDTATDFYLGGYRSETIEPAQRDPNNEVRRFSTVSWCDYRGRTIRSIDQMGRETKAEYNYSDASTSVKIFGPSGAGWENICEQEHTIPNDHNSPHDPNGAIKIIDTRMVTRPGSPLSDPNTKVDYSRDSYVNSQGRWFSRLQKSTDALGKSTTYVYDFDDPNGTRLGLLKKVIQPQINPPSDTNTPTVEYTYNAYGQTTEVKDALGMVTRYEYYEPNQGCDLKKTIVDYSQTSGHLNITTEYTYDEVGRALTVKDPNGNTSTNEYYASGLLKKTTSPSPFNYQAVYEYNEDGSLNKVKRLISAQETLILEEYTYTVTGQKATVRGPYTEGTSDANEYNTNYTQCAYDSLGRSWKVTDAEGHVTETRYFPDGKVWKVIDAKGNAQVTNTYNADGSLQKVTDGRGNITQYAYNGFNGIKTTTFEDGTESVPEYDLARRISAITNRKGQYIEVEYDNISRVTQKILRQTAQSQPDNTITYKYDLTGRVLKTTDTTGTITNTYDTAGRLTSVAYPNSKTVSYQYDLLGRRTRLTYPDNTYVTYEYDQLSRLTWIKNQSGTTLAAYTYDVHSRCTNTTYANGAQIGYQYDVASRLLSLTNDTNLEHKYAYTYDKVGNRLTMLVNDTQVHKYDYDAIYQVTDVNYPAAFDLEADSTFNYDELGNRTSVVSGGTTNYTANALNQYTRVGSTYYDYDEGGNLIYDANYVYTYDVENRLTKVTKGSGANGPLTTATDCILGFTTGGDANWVSTDGQYKYGFDSARSGTVGSSQQTWMQTTGSGIGTIKFYWKVSSESGDNLEFYVDGVLKTSITGISSDWEEKSYFIGAGTHTFKWRYAKDSSAVDGNDCGWVDWVRWEPYNPGLTGLQYGLDTTLPVTTGGDADWSYVTTEDYNDGDSAENGNIDNDQETWMQATVTGSGTVSFWWKVSSEQYYDWLEFYIDNVRRDRISGSVDWQQKTYTVSGTGSHTFKWRYIKDSSEDGGSDSGWVDWLQWTDTTPQTAILPPTNWTQVTYTYDPSGHRIEKKVDTWTQKYVYDGDMVIAEYDRNNNLLRKYVHAGTDLPICIIETGTSQTQYYHYDGLGSVIALSNSSGNTVQTYDYAIYGRVAAEDANHPNPYLFTGQRLDIETGLYYYKARFYNPHIGRFMQTDPIGYQSGMNWYGYCGNNPGNATDPSGCHPTEECGYPYHFHQTLPLWAFTDDTLVTNEQAQLLAFGTFWYNLPNSDILNWMYLDAHLVNGGNAIDCIFIYKKIDPETGEWLPPDSYPQIRAKKEEVRANRDTADDPVVAYVPMIYIDNVGLLTHGKFEDLIRPSISMVNHWTYWFPTWGTYKFLISWDSWFKDKGAFWYENDLSQKHSGSNINYACGGYVAGYFGFSKIRAATLVRLWKAFRGPRLPWSSDIDPVLYWFWIGYDNAYGPEWTSW